jgi:hypothetical protein
MLYSTLWAYQTSVNTTTSFPPFQIIYGMEAILPIECQIPSLKLVVELLSDTSPLEERLLYLEYLYENRCDVALANEDHKQQVKCQSDQSVHHHILSEGNLVMVYDQYKDPLGIDNFKPMWFGPFIVQEVLEKGTYHLVDF